MNGTVFLVLDQNMNKKIWSFEFNSTIDDCSDYEYDVNKKIDDWFNHDWDAAIKVREKESVQRKSCVSEGHDHST